jgi:hypothetical protein
MPSRPTIVIDLGRRRLRALLAQRDGGILRVQSVLTESLPEGVSRDDPEQVGRWVGATLRKAGFPRARAIIALAREHVGLKRLTLPTTDEHELPEMTRLAMQRELPFDAAPGAAVIDFLAISTTDTSTTVLAVAVQEQTLEFARRMARAANRRVERISLRGMGAALILRHLGEGTQGSILAIDITREMIEFCFIDDGAIRFSRAANAPPDADAEQLAEHVITETRRTWMSYRLGGGPEDASDVQHAIIMGDREVSERVAGPLAEMLHVEVEVLRGHPLVDPGGCLMDRVWPLAGLLLESSHGGATINFARPRKAPDRAALRRRNALVAASAIVLTFMVFYTIGMQRIDALERQVAEMEQRQQRLYPDFVRLSREQYRRRHVELWESADVRWLEHLTYLSEIVPSRGHVVLDGWTGSVDFRGVQFDRREREWSAPRHLTIALTGEARDRAAADGFREALVQAEAYTASSTGADAPGGRRLPFGFSYRLRSAAAMPERNQPLMNADEPGAETSAGISAHPPSSAVSSVVEGDRQ